MADKSIVNYICDVVPSTGADLVAKSLIVLHETVGQVKGRVGGGWRVCLVPCMCVQSARGLAGNGSLWCDPTLQHSTTIPSTIHINP